MRRADRLSLGLSCVVRACRPYKNPRARESSPDRMVKASLGGEKVDLGEDDDEGEEGEGEGEEEDNGPPTVAQVREAERRRKMEAARKRAELARRRAQALRKLEEEAERRHKERQEAEERREQRMREHEEAEAVARLKRQHEVLMLMQ